VRAVTAPSRTEPLRASGVRRQVRIDSALDVHVLPAGELLRKQHYLGQIAAQVTGDPQCQPGRASLRTQRLCREIKKVTHATRQPFEIFTVGTGRHGWGRGAHPANNARRALAVATQQSASTLNHSLGAALTSVMPRTCALVALGELLQVQQLLPGHDQVTN